MVLVSWRPLRPCSLFHGGGGGLQKSGGGRGVVTGRLRPPQPPPLRMKLVLGVVQNLIKLV